MTVSKTHKSGFVNIIGKPNAGKSTLMNALVGEKLSIITPKAQTTRHRIMGIISGDDFQIVYSDTPGIIKPKYKLHEKMMQFVNVSLEDADLVLFVTEINDKADEGLLDLLNKIEVPIIIVLNKIDTTDENNLMQNVAYWKEMLPKSSLVAISALEKANIDTLLEAVKENLPEGVAFFDKDQLTDKSERFFASEIIREKIFLNYQEEVPYSCETIVNEYKDKGDIIVIRAEILVERPTQKGIIIGNKGAAIKKLGIEARKDIEAFVGKKVFLELFVKVEENWRNKDTQLKRFGYLNI
jgi:GTPase